MAHPHSAYEVVPYPPPAALVEAVPPPPSPDAVWVDGHWTWRFGRFVWERGGWIQLVRNDIRLSRWDAVYRDDGTLLFAPDVWRGPHGEAVDPPEIVSPANPPPSVLTGEHATPP